MLQNKNFTSSGHFPPNDDCSRLMSEVRKSEKRAPGVEAGWSDNRLNQFKWFITLASHVPDVDFLVLTEHSSMRTLPGVHRPASGASPSQDGVFTRRFIGDTEGTFKLRNNHEIVQLLLCPARYWLYSPTRLRAAIGADRWGFSLFCFSQSLFLNFVMNISLKKILSSSVKNCSKKQRNGPDIRREKIWSEFSVSSPSIFT